jgi:hypothetical protein
MTSPSVLMWAIGGRLGAREAAALVAVAAVDAFLAGALAGGLWQGRLPEVSLLVLVTLAGSLRMLWGLGEVRALAWPAALVAALLTLAPGTGLGWVSVALLGTALVAGGEPAARRPGLLLAGMGGLLLVQAVGLRLVAGPLLAAEAWATTTVFDLVGMGVERSGNLIAHGEHRLAVLLGCSGIVNAGLAALGFLALVRPGRSPLGGAALVAAAMLFLNTVRLAGMAVSPQWHAALHGGTGRVVVDAVGMAIVVGAVEVWGRRA